MLIDAQNRVEEVHVFDPVKGAYFIHGNIVSMLTCIFIFIDETRRKGSVGCRRWIPSTIHNVTQSSTHCKLACSGNGARFV